MRKRLDLTIQARLRGEVDLREKRLCLARKRLQFAEKVSRSEVTEKKVKEYNVGTSNLL